MDSANMTLLLDKGGLVKKGDMRFAVFTVGDLYVLTVDLAEDPGSKSLAQSFFCGETGGDPLRFIGGSAAGFYLIRAQYLAEERLSVLLQQRADAFHFNDICANADDHDWIKSLTAVMTSSTAKIFFRRLTSSQ